MSYLNYPYEDGFKELCAAMPLFYLDVFEMREVLKAEGRLIDGVSGGFELVVADNFILPADEATIEKWETALNIVYEETLTLDQRKQVVIGYICGNGHIGEPEIRDIIGRYTSAVVTVGFARGVITVVIEGEVPGEATLLDTLLRRIPAHLRLFMQIHIRRVFRQDLSFFHGGAIVTAFNPQPVGVDRTSVLPFAVSYGGAVVSGLETQPVSEDRLSRLPLPMSYGGEILSHFEPEPVGEDRTLHLDLSMQSGGYVENSFQPLPIGQDRTFSRAMRISNGGAEVSKFKPDPVSEDKTALSSVSLARGGYLPPTLSGTQAEVKKTTTGRTDGAGGLFYQTHTKSKLIE